LCEKVILIYENDIVEKESHIALLHKMGLLDSERKATGIKQMYNAHIERIREIQRNLDDRTLVVFDSYECGYLKGVIAKSVTGKYTKQPRETTI
jgi:hypothetical protein